MYNGLKCAFIFAGGVSVGAAASWKLLEAKYKQIADEEIASVKELYERKEAELKNEAEDTEPVEAEQTEMKSLINEYVGEGGSEAMNFSSEPYVISPDEFSELDDYDTESLTYYADGTLTDDQDNVIEDVELLIGRDALTHFGEYEDDSVFVRNDDMRTDYEILLDTRDYKDAKKTFLMPSDE